MNIILRRVSFLIASNPFVLSIFYSNKIEGYLQSLISRYGFGDMDSAIL